MEEGQVGTFHEGNGDNDDDENKAGDRQNRSGNFTPKEEQGEQQDVNDDLVNEANPNAVDAKTILDAASLASQCFLPNVKVLVYQRLQMLIKDKNNVKDNNNENDDVFAEDLLREETSTTARQRLLRRKWKLAMILIFNPKLRPWRKHNLVASTTVTSLAELKIADQEKLESALLDSSNAAKSYRTFEGESKVDRTAAV